MRSSAFLILMTPLTPLRFEKQNRKKGLGVRLTRHTVVPPDVQAEQHRCGGRPDHGQRRSARWPDFAKEHGSFGKFLANEKVFSYVIPNKDRLNDTKEIK